MNLKALSLAGVLSLMALPLFAHHSFAIFDQSKVNRISGTTTFKTSLKNDPRGWGGPQSQRNASRTQPR